MVKSINAVDVVELARYLDSCAFVKVRMCWQTQSKISSILGKRYFAQRLFLTRLLKSSLREETAYKT